MTKIGVFGGTFDPIHLGHLLLAERAREQLGLAKVLFLPAAAPPHKQGRVITEGKLRRAMVEIAVGGNIYFEVNDLELKREGVSYTVDTLRELGEQFPGAELYLLVGADMLADIPNWREPQEVTRRAILAAAERPGTPRSLQAPFPHARVVPIEMPELEISSTEIRQRVHDSRSIRYVVPAGVEAFIQAQGLYLS